MDLVLVKGTQKIVVECKDSSALWLTKSFWNAVDALNPDHAFVIAPIHGSYPVQEKVTASSHPVFFTLIASKDPFNR